MSSDRRAPPGGWGVRKPGGVGGGKATHPMPGPKTGVRSVRTARVHPLQVHPAQGSDDPPALSVSSSTSAAAASSGGTMPLAALGRSRAPLGRPSVPSFGPLQACPDDVRAHAVLARAISEAVGEEGGAVGKAAAPAGQYAVAELQSLQAAVMRRRRHARARMEKMQRVRAQLEDWHHHVMEKKRRLESNDDAAAPPLKRLRTQDERSQPITELQDAASGELVEPKLAPSRMRTKKLGMTVPNAALAAGDSRTPPPTRLTQPVPGECAREAPASAHSKPGSSSDHPPVERVRAAGAAFFSSPGVLKIPVNHNAAPATKELDARVPASTLAPAPAAVDTSSTPAVAGMDADSTPPELTVIHKYGEKKDKSKKKGAKKQTASGPMDKGSKPNVKKQHVLHGAAAASAAAAAAAAAARAQGTAPAFGTVPQPANQWWRSVETQYAMLAPHHPLLLKERSEPPPEDLPELGLPYPYTWMLEELAGEEARDADLPGDAECTRAARMRAVQARAASRKPGAGESVAAPPVELQEPHLKATGEDGDTEYFTSRLHPHLVHQLLAAVIPEQDECPNSTVVNNSNDKDKNNDSSNNSIHSMINNNTHADRNINNINDNDSNGISLQAQQSSDTVPLRDASLVVEEPKGGSAILPRASPEHVVDAHLQGPCGAEIAGVPADPDSKQVKMETLGGAGVRGTPPTPFTNAMPSTGGVKSEGAEGVGRWSEMRDSAMMVDVVDDEPAQWAGLEEKGLQMAEGNSTLQERIQLELRCVGLMDMEGPVPPELQETDPVCVATRKAQRQLREVCARNNRNREVALQKIEASMPEVQRELALWQARFQVQAVHESRFGARGGRKTLREESRWGGVGEAGQSSEPVKRALDAHDRALAAAVAHQDPTVTWNWWDVFGWREHDDARSVADLGDEGIDDVAPELVDAPDLAKAAGGVNVHKEDIAGLGRGALEDMIARDEYGDGGSSVDNGHNLCAPDHRDLIGRCSKLLHTLNAENGPPTLAAGPAAQIPSVTSPTIEV